MNFSATSQNIFLKNQLKFERVKNAYEEKWDDLYKELINQGITDSFELCINCFKSEGKLEIWLKQTKKTKFKFFKTYEFSANSGILGPKVIEGDLQTPEGFYEIKVFNPESKYHLSLGINYPNSVDLMRTGTVDDPGSDIYIHGGCFTVGCIPLTDDKIKEVYLLAVIAKSSGQNNIPVNIFPFKMNEINMKIYGERFPEYLEFWQNLQKGYLAFENSRSLPKVIQVKGNYIIK